MRLLIIVILFSFGCRVEMPKHKGFILTPSGWVHKNMLTKQEKKKYKQWIIKEKEKIR